MNQVSSLGTASICKHHSRNLYSVSFLALWKKRLVKLWGLSTTGFDSSSLVDAISSPYLHVHI